MKQNFKKKAFTLVELLVVIAIVAVLASVSIVGYMHFIDKAHTSNDVTLVKQLNTILSASEVMDGKNNTMFDAISDLKASGIEEKSIEASNPMNTTILWDQDSNRFLSLDANKKIVFKDERTTYTEGNEYKLWKVFHDRDVDAFAKNDYPYSIYLSTALSHNKLIEIQNRFEKNGYENKTLLKSGLDVGNYSNIEFNPVYNEGNEKGTIIRMNNVSNLIIENPNAEVSIYGDAKLIDIKDAAKESVHIFGNVNSLSLKKGHLVIESEAVITDLLIESDTYGSNLEDSFVTFKDKVTQINTIKCTNPKLLSTIKSAFANNKPKEEIKVGLPFNAIFKLYYFTLVEQNEYNPGMAELRLKTTLNNEIYAFSLNLSATANDGVYKTINPIDLPAMNINDDGGSLIESIKYKHGHLGYCQNKSPINFHKGEEEINITIKYCRDNYGEYLGIHEIDDLPYDFKNIKASINVLYNREIVGEPVSII